MNRRRFGALLLLLGAAAAFGARLSFEEHAAVQESLARVHPRMRASWLRARGLDESYYTTFHRPESTGLACAGRWPWGPSWELAGRDTFLYLGSGSGVRILSVADSVQPRMLGQINARGLVNGLAVQDTLLFVACGSWGAQIYSVSDPADPRELGSMDAVIGDLCVRDTFCYAVGGDSFRIYNVADPAQPAQLSAIRDSGDVLAEANGYAYVGCGASGTALNVYDVRDPRYPTLVSTLGGVQLALFVRGNLLFRTSVQPSYFAILDISDPSSIHEVGRISGYGGVALYADDKYAYLSCTYDHYGLFVIDISNPSNPQLRDSLRPEGDGAYDSYVPRPDAYGYLAADYGGLVSVDLHNVNSISELWSGYKAHQAIDVCVEGNLAYVANQCAGLRILDVADPTRPQTLGEYDTVGVLDVRSAVARDSFAFISWWGNNRRFLRVLDVTNPATPVFAAEESCFNNPNDWVLRDSLLYAAEANRFQVFNVARPREPRLMGTCSGVSGYSVCLVDTLAYLGSSVPSIVSVADPSNPQVVGQFGRGAWNVSVRDTLAFLSSGGVLVYSVADPSQPRLIDSISLGPNTYWVEAVGTLLYTGNRDGVHVVDASDVHNMRPRGFAATPRTVDRLTYESPHVYASCWEAGVCIFESTQVGVDEPKRGDAVQARKGASVVRGVLNLEAGSRQNTAYRAELLDVSGRKVMDLKPGANDVRALAPGVYFVREAQAQAQAQAVRKVIKLE